MKQTIRHNICVPYSLHDMTVMALEVDGDDMILRTQSGVMKTAPVCRQVDGYVGFQDVRWDFSYVYLLEASGNEGHFRGEKMFLRTFIDRYRSFGFSVMDETYGYNMTKYSGFLNADRHHYECVMEIYHEGDMVFTDETDHEGMAEVILSADDEAKLCLVPAEVAADLDRYCWDFAASWVWHGPDNGRFLHKLPGGQYGAIFGVIEFIDYLNKWAFPNLKSRVVRGLGCYGYELPEEYSDHPRYNF